MIITPKGPEGAERLVRRALAGSEDGHSRIASEGDAPPHFVTEPHRVYAVSREDLLRGDLLDAATPVAWRYLVVRNESAIAAVEIAGDLADDLSVLAADEGWFVDETVAAVGHAERMETVREGTYELRLLRAPAVFFAAVWLKGEQRDLLIPLAPTDPPLRAGSAYDPSDVIDILQQRAKESAAFDGLHGQQRG